ncbi:MAG: HAMP domain-containing sensor histidine kinase [Pseudomonadota bacterium]
MAQSGVTHTASPQDWSVLRTLCWFRLLLCVALAYALAQAALNNPLSNILRTPYFAINALYATIGLTLSLMLWRRALSFATQVWTHVFSDLIVISLLVLTAQGITQTVASLLCIPIAEAVLLRRSKLLYPIAALAIGIVTITDLVQGQLQSNYLATVALSLAFLAVAYLGNVHLRRIGQADDALRAQHRELSSMTDLAEEILDASTQGLIVLDGKSNIRFVNATAMMLLDKQDVDLPTPLYRFDRLLSDAVIRKEDSIANPDHSTALRLHTSQLRSGNTLIALMDMREIEVMTEQSRLASLGRWSASVAHEIRNPLSAISQAVQVLEERDSAIEHKNIIDIMQRNTLRIDAIVKDVLTVSRPVSTRSTTSLTQWIDNFQDEFLAAHRTASVSVAGELQAPGLVDIDEARFFHIVNNLCENALVHGQGSAVQIDLRSDHTQTGLIHTLTVSNPGEPLDKTQRHRMFEPFFTTSTRGSGLGLYVVRELCEQLGLKLRYDYDDAGHHMCVTAPAAHQASDIAA